MASFIKMTALQMVQEVALRLGITRPNNIEIIAGSTNTIIDRDAEILLGALNQSVRSAAAAFTWKDMCTSGYASTYSGSGIDLFGFSDGLGFELYWGEGRTRGFNLNGFDGLLTPFVTLRMNSQESDEKWRNAEIRPRVLKQISVDKYLTIKTKNLYGESGYDNLYEDRYTDNGFIIQNGTLFTAANPEYIGPDNPKEGGHIVDCCFSYKCAYPVFNGVKLDRENRKILFTKNDDMSVIDDECVILGAIMNYKNYIGRDFQLEAKLFTDYIEHMKERNGGLTIIEESEYAQIADRMHRYPPHSSGAQKKAQAPMQQQQGQPQRGPQQE